MGLIILPVAAFFLLIWLAVTGLIVALVAALLKGVPGRPIPQVIGAVAGRSIRSSSFALHANPIAG